MAAQDILGGVGGFLGALLGDALSSGDREKQMAIWDEIERMYGTIPVEVKAEIEQAQQMGPSAFESIQEDPTLRAQQMRTLGRLNEVVDARGLDAEAKADLAEIQQANAATERAQRGNILEGFARRGAGGSNAALLAALDSQQAGIQRSGMEGLRANAMGQARAMEALMNSGALAGNVRSQDYGVQRDRAGAMDSVSQYNASQRAGAAQRNADRRMSAQQQTIQNRFAQAGGRAGALQGKGGMYAERERWKTAAGAGAGQIGGQAAGYFLGGG